MAYSRFSAHCSVYVFPHVDGGVDCCGCLLSSSLDSRFYTFESARDHFMQHIAVGHLVPLQLLVQSTYGPTDFDRVRS